MGGAASHKEAGRGRSKSGFTLIEFWGSVLTRSKFGGVWTPTRRNTSSPATCVHGQPLPAAACIAPTERIRPIMHLDDHPRGAPDGGSEEALSFSSLSSTTAHSSPFSTLIRLSSRLPFEPAQERPPQPCRTSSRLSVRRHLCRLIRRSFLSLIFLSTSTVANLPRPPPKASVSSLLLGG